MNKSIDLVFSVSRFTALNKVRHLFALESTGRIAHVKGPEECICLFKVWTDSVDFVNEIFHADDTDFAQSGFNDAVVGDWDSLLVDFGKSALVD